MVGDENTKGSENVRGARLSEVKKKPYAEFQRTKRKPEDPRSLTFFGGPEILCV